MNVELSDEELAALRALRLWHWEGVLERRKRANWFTLQSSHPRRFEEAEWQNKQANFHLKQVQTLNAFFNTTAEHDYKQSHPEAS